MYAKSKFQKLAHMDNCFWTPSPFQTVSPLDAISDWFQTASEPVILKPPSDCSRLPLDAIFEPVLTSPERTFNTSLERTFRWFQFQFLSDGYFYRC
ncbi:unnamed protein product [Rhizophagus irregularis]|nr:unnamed protein product [Rhizophagus irregularis]